MSLSRLFVLGRLIALASAATGCSHMPLASMAALARVDFETTDPNQLRAAVKLPANVKPRIGVLRVAVKIAGGPEKIEEFRLERVPNPTEERSLRDESEAGMEITAYRLEATEAARVASFREALQTWKKDAASKGRGGSLTLSVSPKSCRDGALPAKVLLTTYLRTGETGAYVPLSRNLDLRALEGGGARDLDALVPPCD